MTTTESGSKIVVRPVERKNLKRLAEIHQRALMDPTSQTPDPLSEALQAEPDPDLGRHPTEEERVARTLARLTAEFSSGKYDVVGAFYPSNEEGKEDEMAGFAIWRRLTPDDESDLPEWKAKVEQNPTLFHRFMHKMFETRERVMQGKSYYFLKLLCIDRQFQRMGIGSTLVRYGTQKADAEGVDAYLESSPAGKGAYIKNGFEVIDYDEVPAATAPGGKVSWPYMIHRPKTAS
ncbi:hypothetical protein BCV70DRAFT_203400 [Testicularia cyperi]|uniref:N-acetyltransferase domain-containing protein n=1 Tax=Testicularia cyperi TaxID=1882483 RepID=A0A317XG42_9BASI|nr:hypothetical protein BCV70DRAFT_203400 [Testicularia cyperi]